MTTDFYEQQRLAMRAAIAAQAGCDPAAFEQERFVIAQRPDPPAWPFTAMFATFGTGTVASTTPEYLEWLAAQDPKPHHAGLYLGQALRAEAKRRGHDMEAGPPGLCWALGEVPLARSASAGYRIEHVDQDQMNEWQQQGGFENACGHREQVHRTFRNRFAIVLFHTGSDQPAAIAGAFDSSGLTEIGVDVARAHRGRGLAPIVVTGAARAILERGELPYYACGIGNIRSQKTALASGFRPAFASAHVIEARLGT